MYYSLIGLGVMIGGIVTCIIFRLFLVGTLRIIDTDDEEQPYILLELTKDPSAVSTCSHVVLKVRTEKHISHD